MRRRFSGLVIDSLSADRNHRFALIVVVGAGITLQFADMTMLFVDTVCVDIVC